LPQALPLASSVAQILEEARRQEGDYSLVLVDTSISYYSGDNEDDALENIGEHLSNEVRVDVHGAEDYDFDSYDFHIDGISEA
jgi:hypothetical protein